MSSPPLILKSEKGMHVMMLSVPRRAVWLFHTFICGFHFVTLLVLVFKFFFLCIAAFLQSPLILKKKKKSKHMLPVKSAFLIHKETAKQIKRPQVYIPQRERKWKHCMNISILPFSDMKKILKAKLANLSAREMFAAINL